jgi:hypothetical protein
MQKETVHSRLNTVVITILHLTKTVRQSKEIKAYQEKFLPRDFSESFRTFLKGKIITVQAIALHKYGLAGSS